MSKGNVAVRRPARNLRNKAGYSGQLKEFGVSEAVADRQICLGCDESNFHPESRVCVSESDGAKGSTRSLLHYRCANGDNTLVPLTQNVVVSALR